MSRKSSLRCYHAVSKRLAKLLCSADEDVLDSICRQMLTKLMERASLSTTKSVIQACLDDPNEVTESELWKAKEVVYFRSREDPDIEHDDVILDVCSACVAGETVLRKVDAMIHQSGRFPNRERDQLFDSVLAGTIGWHSEERGK